MRVNVYREELTSDVEVVDVKLPRATYYGVRLYLKSSDALHHTVEDDDRSAVTIWVGDRDAATYIANDIQSILAGLGVPNE